jgi:hypothetical protein
MLSVDKNTQKHEAFSDGAICSSLTAGATSWRGQIFMHRYYYQFLNVFFSPITYQ